MTDFEIIKRIQVLAISTKNKELIELVLELPYLLFKDKELKKGVATTTISTSTSTSVPNNVKQEWAMNPKKEDKRKPVKGGNTTFFTTTAEEELNTIETVVVEQEVEQPEEKRKKFEKLDVICQKCDKKYRVHPMEMSGREIYTCDECLSKLAKGRE